ncbi:MAG: hypothetical protein EXR27_11320 [Betaproteobacteria bacterium]|nr:hypothetical protein [Betaproteobacteria bacterium]
MAATGMFRRHDPASQARYQDLKRLARSQQRVLAGTPGTLKRRIQAGRGYWVREHIRLDGRKADEYFGAESSLGEAKAAALGAEVALARALASGSSTLRLFGYQRIERRPAAVLCVLFNRGLSQAGLTLVGSHAYGALLNELGIIAAGYRTQDLDVARNRALAIDLPDGVTFQSILQETGLNFVPVPGMPSQRPSGSFKLPGADTLGVDLLVPGKTAGDILPARELGAHAQAIPLLAFLIADAIDGIVLSPNQVVPVRLPSPERFVLHKLYSSQSRKADRDKIRKDLEQAAVLAAALEDELPGRLGETFRAMPAAGKTAVRGGARAAAKLLAGRHAEAGEVLLGIAGR